MPSAAEKVALTDRFLKALKPVADGHPRRNIWDVEPGLVVQVGTKGKPSFFAVGRMPGAKQPTWRKLGEYPALSLAAARDAAREAREAMREGRDPKRIAEARLRSAVEAEAEREANTFGAVAERFDRWYRSTSGKGGRPRRTAPEVAAIIARELTPVWGSRPVAEITERDVTRLVQAIVDRGGDGATGKRKTGGPYAARHAFAAARLLFGWAHRAPQRLIAVDPTAGVRPESLHGAPLARERVLADAEVPPVWRAALATPYPYGPLVQLLFLTGARLREIAEASWGEVDLDAETLTVPTSRAKMKVAHVIPLTPAALEIVRTLPRFDGKDAGRFLFSTTAGRRPISGFSKFRASFNRRLASILEAEGLPAMSPFTLHDIRRSVRTNLSSLRVLPVVAEMVIGHQQKGIEAVYDLHRYDKEKREALRKWERKLLSLVAPSEPGEKPARRRKAGDDNVVPLRRRARA